ncbi:MAG: formate/nitrite transporter family protein [Lachnospiraceae bacterium]|nr:formate/nitrite transporter family protein [Lachnospiraceae bacterium]
MHSPFEIAQNYVEIGIHKVRLSALKMFVLGIFAGIFIAMAGVAATTIAVTIDNPTFSRILSAAIFPAGLSMVLIAGSELFTGNNLIIIALLERKVTLFEMLKNWLFVFLGNLLGAILISALVVYGHTPSLYQNALAENMVTIAQAKASLPFMDAFIRGILCNTLVCLAVWMSFAAKNVAGKMMISYFPIFIFVLCGFEHSIANMYYLFTGIFTAAEYQIPAEGLNLFTAFFGNLFPVTLGNIVGGCGIIGFGYWSMYLMRTPGSHTSKESEQEELQHAEEY